MVPEAGNALTYEDFEEIMEVVEERLKNFPKEPPVIILWTVLANIGDRYAPVECMEKEWEGQKKDLPKAAEGEDPRCPNGHPIRQGPRLSVGWVEDKEIRTRHGI
jgi:hypothetical protein